MNESGNDESNHKFALLQLRLKELAKRAERKKKTRGEIKEEMEKEASQDPISSGEVKSEETVENPQEET